MLPFDVFFSNDDLLRAIFEFLVSWDINIHVWDHEINISWSHHGYIETYLYMYSRCEILGWFQTFSFGLPFRWSRWSVLSVLFWYDDDISFSLQQHLWCENMNKHGLLCFLAKWYSYPHIIDTAEEQMKYHHHIKTEPQVYNVV